MWVGEDTDRSSRRWSSAVVVVVMLDDVVDMVDGDIGVLRGMLSLGSPVVLAPLISVDCGSTSVVKSFSMKLNV